MAVRWLKRKGFSAIASEIYSFNMTGETPDAIGWRGVVSCLVEAKTSRGDFLSDSKKVFRKNPSLGMGSWRFYICPADIIKVEDLPEGWGLIYVNGKKITDVYGVPSNANWSYKKPPFNPCELAEKALLVSILRRSCK